MTRADTIIPLVLKHEGGFVNHPRDPGGATNKGITLATFRKFIKPLGTIEDLKALTTEQAVIVYKRQYWDAVLADMLPSGVDYTVFDFAVNSGPAQAAKILQRVVGAVQDGVIGPATLAAVKSRPPEYVIRKVNAQRLAFMREIRGGSLWETFGKGWQRRVDEVTERSLRDVFIPAPPAQSPFAALVAAILAFFKKG